MLNIVFFENNDLIIRVFYTILNLNYPLVKGLNLLTKSIQNFPFFYENGECIVAACHQATIELL